MRYLLLLLALTGSVIAQAQQALDKADALLLDNQAIAALACLDSALTNASAESLRQQLNIKKAEAFITIQEYKEASTLLNTIREGNPTGITLARLQTIEGMLALYEGRNDVAEENLLQAHKQFEDAGASNTLDAAKAVATLGLVYYNNGKSSQAEEQLLMALSIRTKLLPEDHELMAASYNDLGLIYSSIDQDKALGYYEKALTIYTALHGKSHSKIAINYTNTGVLYQNLELYGDAINNLETALSIWNGLPQASSRRAFVLYQLGYTYQRMKNSKTAEIYLKQSLTEYRKSYGEKHPDIANVLNVLGNLKKSMGAYDTALVIFQQALQSNLKNFKSSNVMDVPLTIDYYNGNYLLYSLMFKAQTFESRHFGKTLKFSDLEVALRHLLVCDTLIDKLRQQSNREADKIMLGTVANEVYADGVRIASHMSEVAFTKRKEYREQAFYFAEKSKSAVLLEAISDVNAKSFAGIPSSLLEIEQQLKTSISLCNQKLSQKPNQEEEGYLREMLFSLNKEYETFTNSLEQKYPEYYNLKFNTSTPSIEALQKLLDPGTALLSYFIDDSKPAIETRLYLFLITQKKLTITSHPLDKNFNKLLTGFRNAIYYNDPATLQKVGLTLGQLLLPNIPAACKSLVIFPTGRLGVIPFEALLTKKPKTDSDVPFLIRKYAVRYEFSASLALQKKSAGGVLDKSSILLCAPITFSEKDNLSDLPGTAAEVSSIAKLFDDANSTQKILTNANANEGTIKSDELKNYKLLHFATHGVVDEVNPELSRIYLKNTGESEDGYLYSGEIYNLQLKASLVTLSACQTGLGKISKGEGVIGLSRALVYAGAKNIIVSYWSVADQSTAELMTNFYRELLQPSSTLHTSLQKVKLDMLNSKNYSAPYYWAPFVLLGF